MRVKYPLNEVRHDRLMRKSRLAALRWIRVRQRGSREAELAAGWCKIWLRALGMRRFDD